jgi:hypothetical protein
MGIHLTKYEFMLRNLQSFLSIDKDLKNILGVEEYLTGIFFI